MCVCYMHADTPTRIRANRQTDTHTHKRTDGHTHTHTQAQTTYRKIQEKKQTFKYTNNLTHAPLCPLHALEPRISKPALQNRVSPGSGNQLLQRKLSTAVLVLIAVKGFSNGFKGWAIRKLKSF